MNTDPTEKTMKGNDASNLNTTDEDLKSIFDGMGTRPEPSEAVVERAYSSLKADWQQQTMEYRSKRSRLRSLQAIAAVSVLGIGLYLASNSTPNQWEVELARGTVTMNGQTYVAPNRVSIAADASLSVSDVARFEMANGADLRLSANTDIEWRDENHLYLNQGSAYINTHADADVVLDTEFGQVRDIGTRFMVTLAEDEMQVAVREGIAEVKAASGTYEAVAQANTTALLTVDATQAVQSTESPSASRWTWIHDASAGYQARTIPDVLALIGRDLGKSVVYASPGVEASIASVTIQGDLSHVRP